MFHAVTPTGQKVPIPLERIHHIYLQHPEMRRKLRDICRTLVEPDKILIQRPNEHMAVKETRARWTVVVFKVTDESDAFVLTAYATKRHNWLDKRLQLWP